MEKICIESFSNDVFGREHMPQNSVLELDDLKDYGRFDFMDLLWTIIGSSIFPITWWFYNYIGLC